MPWTECLYDAAHKHQGARQRIVRSDTRTSFNRAHMKAGLSSSQLHRCRRREFLILWFWGRRIASGNGRVGNRKNKHHANPNLSIENLHSLKCALFNLTENSRFIFSSISFSIWGVDATLSSLSVKYKKHGVEFGSTWLGPRKSQGMVL